MTAWCVRCSNWQHGSKGDECPWCGTRMSASNPLSSETNLSKLDIFVDGKSEQLVRLGRTPRVEVEASELAELVSLVRWATCRIRDLSSRCVASEAVVEQAREFARWVEERTRRC